MPTECTKRFEFEAVARRAVVACFDGGDITSNAGALLLGQVDRGLGLMRRFAACFTDRRDPRFVEHQVETLVGQRIFGLALGYEDLVDHDELRKDPTFAVLAGKLEPVLRSDCEALAGKSTLNRLEYTPKRHSTKYHKIDCDGAKVDALLVDLFVEAHERARREIVIDLDNTDIPLYGMQEGRFFHGYYDDYCYLPLYAFCGRHLLLARQRRANVAGSAGAVEEVARIVARIRRKWRKVRIVLRADSGFANEELMAWCEANRVGYVFGLARNSRLEAALAAELAAAKRQHLASGAPARVFRDFRYRTLDSWSRRRRVVGKAEHNKDGANPRFVVTSLARSRYAARALYEDLPRRGREPHRRAVRTVCRSSIVRHHAGQSAAHVVLRHGLCSGRQLAPCRPAPHSVRRCRRRDHPAQAAQARRSGPQQRAPPSLRARIRLPEQDRIRNGLSVSAASLQLLLSRAPWRKPAAVPPPRGRRAPTRTRTAGNRTPPDSQSANLKPLRSDPIEFALVPEKNRRCRLHTAP